jgi:hypothetical protein
MVAPWRAKRYAGLMCQSKRLLAAGLCDAAARGREVKGPQNFRAFVVAPE